MSHRLAAAGAALCTGAMRKRDALCGDAFSAASGAKAGLEAYPMSYRLTCLSYDDVSADEAALTSES
jgi:hypothetical protein